MLLNSNLQVLIPETLPFTHFGIWFASHGASLNTKPFIELIKNVEKFSTTLAVPLTSWTKICQPYFTEILHHNILSFRTDYRHLYCGRINQVQNPFLLLRKLLHKLLQIHIDTLVETTCLWKRYHWSWSLNTIRVVERTFIASGP